MSTEQESWRPVVGFEEDYSVSNYGQVCSWLYREPRILSPAPNPKSGHLLVILSRYKKRHPRYVHRLVAEAFIGPCPEGQEVRHYPDPDPSHNHADNLCYGTRSANMLDAVEHGTQRNQNMGKTHCDYGHPLSGDNLSIIDGKNGRPERRCKACAARRARESTARNRKPPRPPVEHGTKHGYDKHIRESLGWTKPACGPCKDANTAYYKERRAA